MISAWNEEVRLGGGGVEVDKDIRRGLVTGGAVRECFVFVACSEIDDAACNFWGWTVCSNGSAFCLDLLDDAFGGSAVEGVMIEDNDLR